MSTTTDKNTIHRKLGPKSEPVPFQVLADMLALLVQNSDPALWDEYNKIPGERRCELLNSLTPLVLAHARKLFRAAIES